MGYTSIVDREPQKDFLGHTFRDGEIYHLDDFAFDKKSMTFPQYQAYQDIIEYFGDLARIVFFGDNREYFLESITRQLREDNYYDRLPSRVTIHPLELMIMQNNPNVGVGGECMFDEKGLLVPSREEGHLWRRGVDTEFYQKIFKEDLAKEFNSYEL